ncbi:MAG: glycosyltransferase family 39 protein [Acidobacteria bacterium]|nr:glycosyltransferase family 39 protein [Acidobacteriota bacterium]
MADAPFERDEGEYAYMGQLMLEGVPPYAIAANMKFPGTSAVYAIFLALFGQSITAVHIALLLINAATIWLIYLLGRKLLSSPGASLAAAAAYAALSSGWSLMGMWAHATHFVVLPATAGLLLFLHWQDRPRPSTLIWSGILFGVSVLMKQHGILFAAFAAILILRGHKDRGTLQTVRDSALFGGAAILPFLVMTATLWRAGVADQFWFWAFTYASQYASAMPLAAGLKMLFDSLRHITLANWAIWIAAGAGAVILWREGRFLILGFLLTSFLAICPGLYFREHYFILMLPAVALCAGAAAKFSYPALWAVTAVILFSVFEQGEFLFQVSPMTATNAVYGANPFPEALEIAKYIRSHTAKEETIAVLGSEPEIFFYAQRRSATPYIYMYPLMEAHPFAREMQEGFIRDIETKKPQYVVIVNVATSWLRAADSATLLFDWWSKYAPQNYRQVGIADILPEGTNYRWDSASAGYQPRSAANVVVFKRL